MRYVLAASLILMLSATTASAQREVLVTAQPLKVDALTVRGVVPPMAEASVNPEQVVARLMSFDRNRDGRVAIAELSERMEGLVARGDRDADGALDASEIRALSAAPRQFVRTGGQYGFGDTFGGQSSRNHIENTIDDLRLAPQASAEAKRVALAFADEVEGAASANLRKALTPLLTEEQLAQFEADFKGFAVNRTIQLTSANGTRQTIVVGSDPSLLLFRQKLSPEDVKIATVAVETFRAEQQLDEARRSALVARLSDILTYEEQDNLRAALARRPLVKGIGFQAAIREETIRREFPGNGVPVREIGFTTAPATR
jgi:hypothetical protein